MQYFATPGSTVYYHSDYRKVEFDLPADDGVKYRCYDDEGHRHCSDGPAVAYVSGAVFWFWHGEFTDFETWLHYSSVTEEEKVMLKLKYG